MKERRRAAALQDACAGLSQPRKSRKRPGVRQPSGALEQQKSASPRPELVDRISRILQNSFPSRKFRSQKYRCPTTSFGPGYFAEERRRAAALQDACAGLSQPRKSRKRPGVRQPSGALEQQRVQLRPDSWRTELTEFYRFLFRVGNSIPKRNPVPILLILSKHSLEFSAAFKNRFERLHFLACATVSSRKIR